MIYNTKQEYRFAVATPPPPLDILEFQKSVYEGRYGSIPDDGRDSVATFLVARNTEQSVIASLRILNGGLAPFSFEETLGLSKLKNFGSSPAEIGRWCIAEPYRNVAEAPTLHFGLMKLVLLYARNQSISSLLISVYPEMKTFYRGLYFEDTGIRFRHPDWGEVNLYSMNVAKVISKLQRSSTVLASYLLSAPDKNFVITDKNE